MADIDIRNVWESNLYIQFCIMIAIAGKFQNIALDTQFPGFYIIASAQPHRIYATTP
ncbi:hypothetical protein AMTRI_Chr02g213210 [Amborella trichopoda]